MTNIKIGKKQYKVQEAQFEDERKKGLQGVSSLPKDEGMLFYFDPPLTATMWMKDTLIPLDIVFINEDLKVLKVMKGKPNSRRLMECPNTSYVLEVNTDSGVRKGDLLDFLDSKSPVMKVLALDGTSLMDLYGGERIFSRIFTKQLINLVRKANAVKDDELQYTKYCIRIGKKMFKELKAQSEREPEYVTRD